MKNTLNALSIGVENAIKPHHQSKNSRSMTQQRPLPFFTAAIRQRPLNQNRIKIETLRWAINLF